MRRFETMTALVTGAAGGIGRATALRLAGEGARLVLADRDVGGLTSLAAEIRAAGHMLPHLIQYDAGQLAVAAQLPVRAAAALGQLDVVVLNAGIYRRGHFHQMAPEMWDEVMTVDLASPARILQAAIPYLKARRGAVVAVGSTAATTGVAYAAPYAAAKAGLAALMASLAVEYSADGIRFNTVAPGRVKTGIGASLTPLDDENADLLLRPPRLDGRRDGGLPEDIAAAIAYLASADAAYVTGATLTVDGAQSRG